MYRFISCPDINICEHLTNSSAHLINTLHKLLESSESFVNLVLPFFHINSNIKLIDYVIIIMKKSWCNWKPKLCRWFESNPNFSRFASHVDKIVNFSLVDLSMPWFLIIAASFSWLCSLSMSFLLIWVDKLLDNSYVCNNTNFFRLLISSRCFYSPICNLKTATKLGFGDVKGLEVHIES